MGIYMCMKSCCRVSGEDFAHSIITIKVSVFYSNHFVTFIYTTGGFRTLNNYYKGVSFL